VSFVGEETAYRCGWHVCRLPRKKALTGTDGAVATGIVDVPIRIGKQTLGLQLFVSPHTEDFLVLGRDVVLRVLVRDERLIPTLNNGEVIDTLSDDPFSVIFEVTYLDEKDGWRIGELEVESEARETEMHSTMGTAEIVQSRILESGMASSITGDLTRIQEEEDPPEVELGIRPIATARETQTDGGHEGVMQTLTTLANEMSNRETEEAVWAMGEVHFGNAESADGPTHPFPVLGVVAKSTDELMTPPPITIQLERNRSDLSPDLTDGKRTPAGAESMETAELKEFCPLVDCQLDTMKDYLHPATGSTSQNTGSSDIQAMRDLPDKSTGSRDIQETGSLESQTAEESEVAIITSSVVECTSAHVMIYPNSGSVNTFIIIENKSRQLPVMNLNATEAPGSLERGDVERLSRLILLGLSTRLRQDVSIPKFRGHAWNQYQRK